MGPPPGGDPFSVENRSRIPWFVTAGAYFPNGSVPVFFRVMLDATVWHAVRLHVDDASGQLWLT